VPRALPLVVIDVSLKAARIIGTAFMGVKFAPPARRAFAKSVEVLAADLKPKTQNLRPINQSLASLIKQGVEGFVYRF
jgi:hypothetical protein